MVKHIQTIRWEKPTNCLSVFDHFVGLALKWLTTTEMILKSLSENHISMQVFPRKKS